MLTHDWHYLILTAASESQARLYRDQLDQRARLGLLGAFRQWLVVADPDGKRVGSGGSTLGCLLEVLNRGRGPGDMRERLGELRILIVHAGGDSRRLPAYGPCGKIFIPMPYESDGALGTTLFDYQLPIYAALPAAPSGRGQVVITSGDVLLGFDPQEVVPSASGITGAGCRAAPERAARHGVYCPQHGGCIRRFLQKPSIEVQRAQGAIDQYGETVLDIGVIDFDAETAVRLLEMCDVRAGSHQGRLAMQGEMHDAILTHGMDFYREICCVLGTDTTLDDYVAAVRASGSKWPASLLQRIYHAVSPIPAAVCVLKKCDFLHFGSTREILASGRQIVQRQSQGLDSTQRCLSINSQFAQHIGMPVADAWIEGCRVHAPISLSNSCVLVGVDVVEPLEMPVHACLDILPGRDRGGAPTHFVRCYYDDDPLHHATAEPLRLCGQPIPWWLTASGTAVEALWDRQLPLDQRCTWNARLFPAERRAEDYRSWLWMLRPTEASPEQLHTWAAAERYSFAEMVGLADIQAFHARRTNARAASIRDNLRRQFRGDSGFSAQDLAYLLCNSREPSEWFAALIQEVRWQAQQPSGSGPQQAFALSRILHTIGSAIELQRHDDSGTICGALVRGANALTADDRRWLDQAGLGISADTSAGVWAERAKRLAFEHLRAQIISHNRDEPFPRNALRPDEIVWGRAPARLDLGGGWTDTPPYALEHGGCVLNAAVELNGQPPIQAFARVTREPLIRVRSIDVGTQLEMRDWDQLMDCAVASGEFSLVQAALAISGFGPHHGRTLQDLLNQFGGGLEITTLAAIPKGSGLGTSSIMGCVLLAVIHRVLGRELTTNDLFCGVLRLEQKLTTGGGWQDQIGGSVGGLKLISSPPGMVPDATIRYVPADVLDPLQNGGRTLLYYTGITRLAKNILQQVVGRFLDRDRDAIRVLQGLHAIAPQVAEAMACKDITEFGRLIDQVWQLNKRLDPDSSNSQIEEMLARVKPWIFGAKLLGAGGGGFLLLVCRSPEDAQRVQTTLNHDPPNDRARFFEFAVSVPGLAVSVC
ncbi:MAG: fucose pyrophosphorylase domain-containing protein [Pirellulaceae bacterium]